MKMGFRTYLPQLLALVKILCKYMLRWEDLIKANLGGGAPEAAFDAVLTACQDFVPLLEALIPPAS
jgi:hypothetical protein